MNSGALGFNGACQPGRARADYQNVHFLARRRDYFGARKRVGNLLGQAGNLLGHQTRLYQGNVEALVKVTILARVRAAISQGLPGSSAL